MVHGDDGFMTKIFQTDSAMSDLCSAPDLSKLLVLCFDYIYLTFKSNFHKALNLLYFKFEIPF